MEVKTARKVFFGHLKIQNTLIVPIYKRSCISCCLLALVCFAGCAVPAERDIVNEQEGALPPHIRADSSKEIQSGSYMHHDRGDTGLMFMQNGMIIKM